MKGAKGIALWFGLLGLSPLVMAEATPVRTAPVMELAIHPELSAPAQVLSLNDSRIEAAISATVERIPVRVGDEVAAGSELVALECDDQRNTLRRGIAGRDALKARLEFADYQYQRARSLKSSNSLSEEALRQRAAESAALRSELAGAEAQVAQAGRDVGRCSVRAPFRAVVVERLIGVGEKAQQGKPLLRLLDLSALEVSAQVPAFDAQLLPQAHQLSLEIGDTSYPVTLRSVVPALDPKSRSRELRLDFIDSSAPPGSSGRLVWRQPTPHLPAEYLLRRGGEYGIFVLREGKARFVKMAGAREGSAVAVSLPGDTQVITEGRFGLNDGDVVSVVE